MWTHHKLVRVSPWKAVLILITIACKISNWIGLTGDLKGLRLNILLIHWWLQLLQQFHPLFLYVRNSWVLWGFLRIERKNQKIIVMAKDFLQASKLRMESILCSGANYFWELECFLLAISFVSCTTGSVVIRKWWRVGWVLIGSTQL